MRYLDVTKMNGTDMKATTKDNTSSHHSSVCFHIIGLGVNETAYLSDDACTALNQVDVVIGSDRQLKVVEHLLNAIGQKHCSFPKFSEFESWISTEQAAGQRTFAVLASGDPLYFGIGRWFSTHFTPSKLRYYPAVSSVQAACHKVGLSLQDADVISLHGRPLERLRDQIKQNQKLVILTDDKSRPEMLAQECIDLGFLNARLHVCERLGYENERISSYQITDSEIAKQSFDPLHVSIIETEQCERYVPEFPGIPDAEFITDAGLGKGLITKREVRLSILSLMQPTRDDVIWDIGAGCGSVAIELSKWQSQQQVFAIEHHSERLQCLHQNRSKFGVVSNLKIIEGRAPEALGDLPQPNKVFIGGSDGELESLLTTCWKQLPPNGVLVASAVTENTKQVLFQFLQIRQQLNDSEFEGTQLTVSRASNLANQLLYRPNFPVTLFKWVKTS